MENVSGNREPSDEPFKSRKGFGYRVRQARARPSNTSVRELLSDGRYTGDTKVGEVKAGVICK